MDYSISERTFCYVMQDGDNESGVGTILMFILLYVLYYT